MLVNDNDESRRMIDSCYKKRKTVLNPIIDWSNDEVWEFIHYYNVPYCSLYDEGYKRLGCIGCPMGGTKHMKAVFERYPKYEKLYLRAFDKMLIEREKAGLETKWESAEEVMKWWLDE